MTKDVQQQGALLALRVQVPYLDSDRSDHKRNHYSTYANGVFTNEVDDGYINPLYHLTNGNFDAHAELWQSDCILVLKALVRAGRKVKFIYIDPPYNTKGKSFVYRDDFPRSIWLVDFRVRLELAKEVLSEDGFIVVQLDEEMTSHAQCMLDEVFGYENRQQSVIYKRKSVGGEDAKTAISAEHDTIWIYSKNHKQATFNDAPYPERIKKLYNKEHNGRKYRLLGLQKTGKNSLKTDAPNCHYAIEASDGTKVYPTFADGRESCWRWGQEKLNNQPNDIEIHKITSGVREGQWTVSERDWLDKKERTVKFKSMWGKFKLENDNGEEFYVHYPEGIEDNVDAKKQLKQIVDNKIDISEYTPKARNLMYWLIYMLSNVGDTVLDFYAGTGATGEVAVAMGRKTIMCELDTNTHRIIKQRLGSGYIHTMRKEEVFTLDISEVKAWNRKPSSVYEQKFYEMSSNIGDLVSFIPFEENTLWYIKEGQMTKLDTKGKGKMSDEEKNIRSNLPLVLMVNMDNWPEDKYEEYSQAATRRLRRFDGRYEMNHIINMGLKKEFLGSGRMH